MKLLLTGATGYIGRSLVPHLLAQNWQVVSLQRTARDTHFSGTARDTHSSIAPGGPLPERDTHFSIALGGPIPERDTHFSIAPGGPLPERDTHFSKPPAEPLSEWDTHSSKAPAEPLSEWDTHSSTPASTPPVTAIVHGDLQDPEALALACQGVDVVIHLAGIAHVGASEADLRAFNLTATLNLARAARLAGARRFIFISSSKARYPSHSAYGRLKMEAEAQLLAMHHPASFAVICLRPSLVYGPGMRGNLAGLLRLLQRKTLPVFVSSEQRMGMIGREDLCRAIVLAVTSGNVCGAIWELSDGETYTLNAIVARARAMLGLRPPLLNLPRPLVRLLALAATTLSPLHRSSLSMSTYKTLFEEDYQSDVQFAQATGFAPAENFYHSLPHLLGVPKA